MEMVKEVVDDWDADIEAKTRSGWKPLLFASYRTRIRRQQSAIDSSRELPLKPTYRETQGANQPAFMMFPCFVEASCFKGEDLEATMVN
jgi:hypothetical protein